MTWARRRSSSIGGSASSAPGTRRPLVLWSRSIAGRAARRVLPFWQYSDWGARYLGWLEPILAIGQVVVSKDLGQGIAIALSLRLCRAVLGYLDINYWGLTAWLVDWSTARTPARVIVVKGRHRGASKKR